MNKQKPSIVPIHDERRFVDEHVISAATGYALQTLRTWRHQGRGFPYCKIGRSVRYDLTECLRYMDNHKIDLGVNS